MSVHCRSWSFNVFCRAGRHKETHSNITFSGLNSRTSWETGAALIDHKKSKCVTDGILGTLDLPGAATLAFVGVSLGVSALWLRREEGHSSDTAVHSVLSGACHTGLYPALSHGQSSARQQPPFAIKKKTKFGIYGCSATGLNISLGST